MTSEPVEITLGRSNWLGKAGDALRGYLNLRWDITSKDRFVNYVMEPRYRHLLVGHDKVLASRLHLHFAAQPEFLDRFFFPYTPERRLASV